jgi:hypothetical protein
MQELDFRIAGKKYSNIFVSKESDDDVPEVRLSIHIIGGSLATKMTIESARELMEALKEIVESK